MALGGTQNHQVTDEHVERCRALVAAIDGAARQIGAYEAQRQWIGPDGQPIHSKPLLSGDISVEFLSKLPQRATYFTGWPIERGELTRVGTGIWRGLRFLSPMLAARVLTRWWHRLQRTPGYYAGLPGAVATELADLYALSLPSRLRPGADFDGTEPDRVALCERLIAMDRLGLLRRLAAIDRPVILEIGAGYGMLAAALIGALPRATYVIVDLPSSLALSGCYLASRSSRRISLVRGAGNIVSGEIGLVLSVELPVLEGLKIDLAINTLSFGEMSEAVVDGYAAFLQRNLGGGLLFEQNFDCTHFAGPNFCDPSRALARHFHLQPRRARGFYMKGQPRLWVTS
jgi:hypothetical protein